MDINEMQSDLDGITAKWVNNEPYVVLKDFMVIREHILQLFRSYNDATRAIVTMAEEAARNLYGIEADKQYWRLFVPEVGRRALGWKLHEWHTAADHDCHDPYCNLCNLSVCRVCGLYEGGLTTECPGEPSHSKSDQIYNGRLDFREGKWVEELSPHQQHCEMHQAWKRKRR